MIDIVRLLARYNAQANTEMNKVLASLTPEEWGADRGGHFPSFRSLTAHIYTADTHWLVRFTGLRPFQAIKGSPFDFPPSFGEPLFETVSEYLDLRSALDAKLTAFAGEVTPADTAADLTYRNSRGEQYTKNFGGLVLHMFNHQTHHRGAISMLLDQMKKPNDYSNLSGLL